MTTPEENKKIVYQLNDIWQGDLEIVNELVAESYKNHNPIVPDAPPGPEGFKQNVTALLTAFPDLNWTLEDVIAEDDKVVFRAIGHGTHEGELMGIEPTGREVTLSGIVIFRIDDGRVVERWAQFDTTGMLSQLGVSTYPSELSRSS
ncbi:ester cyclase [Haloarcula sp. JP-L23]|uniref:ester cyclase n=1 Tax=Haloarcula sp. JP-L23 TaxID=2716717 RepID=UPI00140F372D|nr:ester cyclase [Haloarcula sp. JP-L23]